MLDSASVIRLLNGRVLLPHSFIFEHAYCRKDDVVIVAGTLIEGIGNLYSDIDVYVITNRLRRLHEIDTSRHHRVVSTGRQILKNGMADCDVLLIHTVIPESSIKVDIEYCTFTAVEMLINRVNILFNQARESLILLVKVMSEREESFIHRVFHGMPIKNVTLYETLVEKLDKTKYCYLLYRWKASDFSILIDLLGSWQNGELDRSVDIARENLICQMFAYIHLKGGTSSRRKWLLQQVEEFLVGPEELDLKDDFMDYFYLRGTDSPEGKIEYVRCTLDLVDKIYEFSAHRLQDVPEYPSGDKGLAVLRENHERSIVEHKYASMEFDYRARVYGVSTQATREWLGEYGCDSNTGTANSL